MDFLQLAVERYSVRKFSPKALSKEEIEKILKAGQLAPTACNNQPQKILVINSSEALEALKKCTSCHFNAPCAMLVCFDKEQSWKRSYDKKDSGDIDAAIVTTHMMLEAASLGIGSTWVMHFDPEAMRVEFALPENLESTALLVMGYPADDAVPSVNHQKSKPIEELVSFNVL